MGAFICSYFLKEISLRVESLDGNYFLLVLEKPCHLTLAPWRSEESLCGAELLTGQLLFWLLLSMTVFSFEHFEDNVNSVLLFFKFHFGFVQLLDYVSLDRSPSLENSKPSVYIHFPLCSSAWIVSILNSFISFCILFIQSLFLVLHIFK